MLALESRRGTELAALIRTYGGQPIEAPALREVPLESNPAALDFANALMRDEYDIVIFLTGVGTRVLVSVVVRAYPREAFIAALARTKVVVRGPKPLAVMRELHVPVWVAAPEPNNLARPAGGDRGQSGGTTVAWRAARGARVRRF